ncbi:peptidoglycan-binding protein [Streptomyces sp. NPDC017941]|uniref:peptidoglycan-binding domain-containing protein n=1 Tax=Streptomyces sp. NPDC017941 TaxID=3365018 RepID=UPI0037927340
MTGAPAGAGCPGCGATRGPGGEPACGCAGAAARAVLETRSAQAAAAEDFDPLRIRPYVTLPEPSAPPPLPASCPALRRAAQPHTTTSGTGAGTTASGTGAGTTAGTWTGAAAGTGADAWPGTVAGAGAGTGAEPVPGTVAAARERRRSRAALFSGAGMLAASAAVFAGGMYAGAGGGAGGVGGHIDRALPDTASGNPDRPQRPPRPERPAPEADGPALQTSVRSAAPEPTRTAPPETEPAPKPSASSPKDDSPRTPREPATSPTRTTARVTGTVILPPDPRPQGPRPLSLGDTGPAVSELQHRLGQLSLYAGPRDGTYSPAVAEAVIRYQWARGVTDDPPGTYGRATRRALETETTAP